jgi:imidazolonepropionase
LTASGADLVVTGIGSLVTNDPTLDAGPLGTIRDAALVIVAGAVVWRGPERALPDGAPSDRLDVAGRAVIPGLVDSHTHLVFTGARAEEFSARMAGEPYAAGGIRVTTEAVRSATDDTLRAATARRLAEAHRSGITTVEIKSGYGLTVADEARCLRLGREFTDETTFLGAHVVPVEFDGRSDDYVEHVCGPMLEACAPHARWIDVFCELGAFDEDQSRAVLAAGRAAGLGTRIHANQLGHGPGVRLAVEQGAASADHCTYLNDADIDALASGTTVCTFLPAADFSTRSPYPDARRVVDAGATVALATNCNPGSSFTTSMLFVIALAVRDLHLTADEALWSATSGGARALRRTDVGHLGVGARADLVVLDAPSHHHIAYRPGMPLVASTLIAGCSVFGSVSTIDR